MQNKIVEFVHKQIRQLNVADYQSAMGLLVERDFHEFSREILDYLYVRKQYIDYTQQYELGMLNARSLYD